MVTNCSLCGAGLFHEEWCGLPLEEVALRALEALQFARATGPLEQVCACELGYPGMLGCSHKRYNRQASPPDNLEPQARVTRCSAGDDAPSRGVARRPWDSPSMTHS